MRELVYQFLLGLRDGINLLPLPRYLFRSPLLRERVIQCVILNGVLFLGMSLVMQHVFAPFVRLVLYEGTENEAGNDGFFDVFVDIFELFWFYTFWVIPFYIISLVLNQAWYQDIAQAAYEVKFNKANDRPFQYAKWLQTVVSEIYGVCLGVLFLLQVCLFQFIPVLGAVFSFVGASLLYSLYSFEYLWSLHGWSLEKRIDFFERHWAFMAGFGSFWVLITIYLPFVYRTALFALVLPVLIIVAGSASPTTPPPSDRFQRLPLFLVPRLVLEFLCSALLPSTTRRR